MQIGGIDIWNSRVSSESNNTKHLLIKLFIGWGMPHEALTVEPVFRTDRICVAQVTPGNLIFVKNNFGSLND
jgi:hypothetical protein